MVQFFMWCGVMWCSHELKGIGVVFSGKVGAAGCPPNERTNEWINAFDMARSHVYGSSSLIHLSVYTLGINYIYIMFRYILLFPLFLARIGVSQLAH